MCNRPDQSPCIQPSSLCSSCQIIYATCLEGPLGPRDQRPSLQPRACWHYSDPLILSLLSLPILPPHLLSGKPQQKPSTGFSTSTLPWCFPCAAHTPWELWVRTVFFRLWPVSSPRLFRTKSWVHLKWLPASLASSVSFSCWFPLILLLAALSL